MATPQSSASETDSSRGNSGVLWAVLIICIAVTGYFVGIKSPMNPEGAAETGESQAILSADDKPIDDEAIPATSYADLSKIVQQNGRQTPTSLTQLKELPYDPYAEIVVTEADKRKSLLARAKLRAFNGAPPTVPHPIDQMTSRGCMVCHEKGLKARSLRAAKIPHPYYSGCTQCHVEYQSRADEPIEFRENSFVGMPAPVAGPRAFSQAPPVMPHSRWLRQDCLSCHGRTASPGMQATHPWRKNCEQCHAESSTLNQTLLDAPPKFLPGPVIESSNEPTS